MEGTVATNPFDRENNPDAIPGEDMTPIGSRVSPEARAVLIAALSELPKRSLFGLLSSMPDVGEDSDFAHSQG
jgi:hypothetical protein